MITHIRVRPLQIFSFALVVFFCAAFSVNAQDKPAQSSSASAQTPSQPAPQVPNKIDGGVGACTASFTVRDGSNKPLYNAQISVQLRYGFMNMRKTDLQLGTDSNGKAQFTGLPNFPKKPLAFDIKSGTVSKLVTDDPNTNCTATFDVVLTVHETAH